MESLIYAVFCLVMLIVFFVMAANISAIKRDARNFYKGHGAYVCGLCKKYFVGRKKDCPHCGEKINYGN